MKRHYPETTPKKKPTKGSFHLKHDPQAGMTSDEITKNAIQFLESGGLSNPNNRRTKFGTTPKRR